MLMEPRKWMASNGVKVHISDSHLNYVDMYRYAKKTDTEAIESDNHCNLDTITSPRTKHAQRTNRRQQQQQQQQQPQQQQQQQQQASWKWTR